MSNTSVKLHKSKTTGKWVPCHAEVRSCPLEHVTVSGDVSEATKFFAEVGVQEEINSQKPDILKLGQSRDDLWKPEPGLAQRAADTWTARMRMKPNLNDYELPQGSRTSGPEAQRYAQVVTTTAINVLIDQAQPSSIGQEYAYSPKVKRTLDDAIGVFTSKDSQDALRLSQQRTLAILAKHTTVQPRAINGFQERINVRAAIKDLEQKLVTEDLEDPRGANRDLGGIEPSSDYGIEAATEAAATFKERTGDLNTYEIADGLNAFSPLATTHNQKKAQDVTRSAISNVLNARSLVNPEYAEYREVDRRLNSYYEVLRVTDDATQTSIDRAKAILKREASMQELAEGRRGAYVHVRSALHALEQKGLTVDLTEPVPAAGADRNRAERNAQQREGVKAIRAARRAAAVSDIPAEGALTSETESARLWREDQDEFYRQNRENALAKAKADEDRHPPRLIPASKKSSPQVNGPR